MLPQISIVRLTDTQTVPLPNYADGVGTCMILRSNEAKSVKIAPQHFEIFSTGFAMALPIGMEAQVRSLKESNKTGLIVLNAPLTIDASDRGEIKVCLFNASQESIIVKQGDPMAILVFSLALRVQWKDLTEQVVGRIHEKQSQNKEDMLKSENESQEKHETSQVVEEKSTTSTEDETSSLTQEETGIALPETDSNEQEAISTSEEEHQTEEIELPAILEENKTDEVGPSAPQEKIVVEDETSFSPIISEEEHQAEEIELPAILEENKTDEVELSPILEENLLVDEPVMPPAILEEFEKIESEYQMENQENKSE